MKEEKVTIHILTWLQLKGWAIVSYDFPQSGTGTLLHPNTESKKEKNKGGFIPDIVAVKGQTACFFENKDRYYKKDFDKLYEIKMNNSHSCAIDMLLDNSSIENIAYGIGIPHIEEHIEKCFNQSDQVDFIISTDKEGKIDVHHDVFGVFTDSN